MSCASCSKQQGITAPRVLRYKFITLLPLIINMIKFNRLGLCYLHHRVYKHGLDMLTFSFDLSAHTLACGQYDGVTIRMMDGRRIRLADVSFSDTVDALKRRIFTTLQSPCKNLGFETGEAWPPEKQKLWAYGCYLENGRTLSDYHLKSGDRIHLTLRIDE